MHDDDNDEKEIGLLKGGGHGYKSPFWISTLLVI